MQTPPIFKNYSLGKFPFNLREDKTIFASSRKWEVLLTASNSYEMEKKKQKKKLSISDLYLYWLTEEWLLWVRMQCADGCFGKISFRLTSSKPFRAVCANSLQSGLALYLPYGLEPARLLSPWDSPDKITRVGCCAHPQVIFLTQVSNPCLLYLLNW